MSNKSIYTKFTYHYTYQIFNTKTRKFYIGVRSSKVDPIKDIGIRYFSSSHDKDFKSDQKLNPQDYEYTVLNLFQTRKESVDEEIALHTFYNVGNNKRFYNKSKQSSTGFDFDSTGIKRLEETKQKMSESKKGTFTAKDAKTGELIGVVSVNDQRVLSGEVVNISKGTFVVKNAETGEIVGRVSIDDPRVLSGELVHVRKGKTVSDETKRKISESKQNKNLCCIQGTFAAKNAETGEIVGRVSVDDPRVLSGELVHVRKGKTHTDETKRKMSKSKKGKTVSDETKQKMSKSKKGTFAAKNAETGEIVGRVSVDDQRVLSGELVHVRKGKTVSDETKQKMSESHRGKFQVKCQNRQNCR